MQISLFDLAPAARVSPIWERIPGPAELGSKGIIHIHTPSRMQVHHCGHPTANFPYFILDIQNERRILAPNGRGFQRLNEAKQHVEHLHNGTSKDSSAQEAGES